MGHFCSSTVAIAQLAFVTCRCSAQAKAHLQAAAADHVAVWLICPNAPITVVYLASFPSFC